MLVGGVIIAVIVVISGLILSIDELSRSREEHVRLYAVLPDAGTVTSGAPVWLTGHEVGRVEAITFLAPGAMPGQHILAELSLPQEHLDQIRRDSGVRVVTASLMGQPLIEVMPGSRAAGAVLPGDTLRSQVRSDDPIDFARVEALGERFQDIKRNAAAIDSMLSRRAPALEGMQAGFSASAAELDRLKTTVRAGPLSELSEARLAERVERISADFAAVRRGLDRYGRGQLAAQLEGLDERTDALRAELDSLAAATSTPYGFIGRVAADSALMKALNGARAQLDSLVRETTADPFRYFF